MILGRNERDKHKIGKGDFKMATQLQPTPTLYGNDAKEVIEQIKRKPSLNEKRKAEERRTLFAQVTKKGLR